jgi:hypothetical protein
MQNTIAFCTDVESFNKNRILNSECASLYPGAMWIVCLSEFCQKNNMKLVTGDVAISLVYNKELKAESVLIIQDDCARHAEELLGLGAKPFLLMCLESPVYAGKFYSSLRAYSLIFKNRLLFKGFLRELGPNERHLIVYFPSFSKHEVLSYSNWEDRDFLSIVAGNKYWNQRKSVIRFILSKIKDIILSRKKYVNEEFNKLQLHDKRLELIEYFGSKNKLAIFGPGWKSLANLPKKWESKLNPIISKINPDICKNKIETISKYKFNLCLENMMYPGYVTEKIIDCFRARVIPIYLGAPDILDFVPQNTFIDLRNFKNLESLMKYLESLNNEEALSIIENGQKFLKSENGLNFSYEEFAQKVYHLIEATSK